MSTQEANKQICRDYFKAFLARDTAWMARHIAPDFVRHSVAVAPVMGRDLRLDRVVLIRARVCNALRAA